MRGWASSWTGRGQPGPALVSTFSPGPWTSSTPDLTSLRGSHSPMARFSLGTAHSSKYKMCYWLCFFITLCLRLSKSICSGLGSGMRALLGPSQSLASRHVHSIATGLGRNTDNLSRPIRWLILLEWPIRERQRREIICNSFCLCHEAISQFYGPSNIGQY